MPSEDNEDNLLKKKIKKHERKYKAFEKETFDVFDYNDNDELENEEFPDDNTPKEVKARMWRSTTNGFFKRKDSDLVAGPMTLNSSNVYDDSDSIFRSSLKGFFTGKNKENKYGNATFYASTNSTRETNEYSTLVSNNDVAFSGNPIRALKHTRKNMFSNYGSSEALEAKGIEELISDFNNGAKNFKKSMQNIDVSEKLKQNYRTSKVNELMETPEKFPPKSVKLPKEAIAFSTKKFLGDT